MAAFPLGLAFLILAPGPDAPALASSIIQKPIVDHAVQQAAVSAIQPKINNFAPPLPKTGLPLAVDKSGVIHEPVIQAIYEESASEYEQAKPSPQSPRRLTDLPPFTPAPSGSPVPSA